MQNLYQWECLPQNTKCRVFYASLDSADKGYRDCWAYEITAFLIDIKQRLPNSVWAVYQNIPMSQRVHAQVGYKLIEYTGDWFKGEYYQLFDELKDDHE